VKPRLWPVALAGSSALLLISFLLVSERLVGEIRRSTEVHTRMYALVQEGLLSTEESADLRALLALQSEFTRLGVPIVALNAAGEPVGAQNLPFDVDVTDRAAWPRIVAYARRLEGPPIVTAAGSIHVGEPPLLGWLRWLPWLQVGGGLGLLLVAVGLLRANLRAERERMWAAMARELAHQMGTPLSSLSGWVELLDLPPEERAKLATPEQIATHIGADVQRLERVSRRFELVGKAPALKRVVVDGVLAELEAYMRPRLPRFGAGVEYRSRIRGSPPALRANQVLLVWALENVVKNALDALAGRGGRIRVVAWPVSPGWVRISVVDNGPGIDASIRDRIFEPGVTTKASGWGVGLSLARRIIEDHHGGRITVRPRRGGGSIFDIRLPADGSAGGGAG
jgi:signal transduction histidine kinase